MDPLQPFLTHGRTPHWDNVDIDIDWIMENHHDFGPGLVTKDVRSHLPELAPFQEFVRSCFNVPIVLDHSGIRVVYSHMVNPARPEFCECFPDNHHWPDIHCVVVCVQEPEPNNVNWGVGVQGSPWLWTPSRLGDAVVIQGNEWHTVDSFTGEKPRITLASHFRLMT